MDQGDHLVPRARDEDDRIVTGRISGEALKGGGLGHPGGQSAGSLSRCVTDNGVRGEGIILDQRL